MLYICIYILALHYDQPVPISSLHCISSLFQSPCIFLMSLLCHHLCSYLLSLIGISSCSKFSAWMMYSDATTSSCRHFTFYFMITGIISMNLVSSASGYLMEVLRGWDRISASNLKAKRLHVIECCNVGKVTSKSGDNSKWHGFLIVMTKS